MKGVNNLLLAFALALVTMALAFFTVYQTDLAFVLRFKKIKTNKGNQSIVYKPGIHMKIPLLDDVITFDTRSTILDIKASRITTVEKKDLLVDYYVLWRIRDIALYYNRTQGVKSKTEALLEQKANAVLKIEFGQLNIKEVVSSARSELMDTLRKKTKEHADDLGIEIIDVRIKRIDLPKEVSDSVYTRMREERKRNANSFRAAGEKDSITLRADADKKRMIILSTAHKEANRIRGEGDAKAMEIYSAAYGRSPQFYEFYKSLNTYKESFKDKDDILILKPEGDFFKYFNNSGR
ncbi:MAG TPA: protease modulator HflC [Gammaproteobacteria bacterium]|nr:protease modulator HflC [Gammaproteobacteria bacterium]